jgi:predicted glutamine amidotransferase
MCGIWGFSGPISKFNKTKFDYIGKENDSRGGDGSGFYIDGTIYRGVNDWAKYEDLREFFIDVTGPKKNTVALGHARKLSTGKKIHEHTQPLRIKFGKKEAVIIHNGTIDNIDDLCKKFKINVKEETDSYLFGKLILKAGFETILSQYVGSAALAYVYEDEPNTIYLFKGKSLYTSYAQIAIEERPLYLLQEEGYLYFSSIKPSLKFIRTKKSSKIIDLDCNTLYKVKNGVIEKIAEINRSSMLQKNPVVTTTSFNRDTDDWYRNKYGHEYSVGKFREDGITIFGNKGDKWLGENDPAWLDIKDAWSYYPDQTFFVKGRYYCSITKTQKLSLMDGVYKLDESGEIYPDNTDEIILRGKGRETIRLKKYYFINGVMITNVVKYSEALKDIKKMPNEIMMYNILSPYSVYPIGGFVDKPLSPFGDMKPSDEMPGNGISTGKYFTGSFKPLFSEFTYHFETGDFTYAVKGETMFADHNKELVTTIEDELTEEKITSIAIEIANSLEEAKNELLMLEGNSKIDSLRDTIDSMEKLLYVFEYKEE